MGEGWEGRERGREREREREESHNAQPSRGYLLVRSGSSSRITLAENSWRATFPKRAAPPRHRARRPRPRPLATTLPRPRTCPARPGPRRRSLGRQSAAGRSRASVGRLACPLRLSPPCWRLRSRRPGALSGLRGFARASGSASGMRPGGAGGRLREGNLCPPALRPCGGETRPAEQAPSTRDCPVGSSANALGAFWCRSPPAKRPRVGRAGQEFAVFGRRDRRLGRSTRMLLGYAERKLERQKPSKTLIWPP